MDYATHIVQSVNGLLSGGVLPHPASRRDGDLHDRQAAIRADSQVRRRHEAGLRRLLLLRQSGRPIGHDLLSVARDGHFRTGRHRQPRRRRHRDGDGRPRRHLLDVGRRLLRHGDDLLGSDPRAALPRQRRARTCDGGTSLLHQPRPRQQAARRFLLGHDHRCARLHRQHGAVELDRRRLLACLRHRAVDHGDRHLHGCRLHLHRRHPTDRKLCRKRWCPSWRSSTSSAHARSSSGTPT